MSATTGNINGYTLPTNFNINNTEDKEKAIKSIREKIVSKTCQYTDIVTAPLMLSVIGVPLIAVVKLIYDGITKWQAKSEYKAALANERVQLLETGQYEKLSKCYIKTGKVYNNILLFEKYGTAATSNDHKNSKVKKFKAYKEKASTFERMGAVYSLKTTGTSGNYSQNTQTVPDPTTPVIPQKNVDEGNVQNQYLDMVENLISITPNITPEQCSALRGGSPTDPNAKALIDGIFLSFALAPIPMQKANAEEDVMVMAGIATEQEILNFLDDIENGNTKRIKDDKIAACRTIASQLWGADTIHSL